METVANTFGVEMENNARETPQKNGVADRALKVVIEREQWQ